MLMVFQYQSLIINQFSILNEGGFATFLEWRSGGEFLASGAQGVEDVEN
jgi:hypothetical protein